MTNITQDSFDYSDLILDKLSEKDRLIMAIQKLWSVKAYLYTVQITSEELNTKYNYNKAGFVVESFINTLANELFNVSELKQKYYEAMTRNQKG